MLLVMLLLPGLLRLRLRLRLDLHPVQAQFREGRAALLRHDLPGAEKRLGGWGGGALGTFQYGAALALVARPSAQAWAARWASYSLLFAHIFMFKFFFF